MARIKDAANRRAKGAVTLKRAAVNLDYMLNSANFFHHPNRFSI